MKKYLLGIFSLALLATLITGINGLRAAPEPGAMEYVTLRWDGRDNTRIIRPNGTVESLATQFANVTRPPRTDDRSFYMNVAMNSLAREGFELAAMTSDDYVFKRAAR
ncbi:MAG TPA: hypothetical protein PLX89_08925 [Verrucomicrobiota bacterium]|nr:hypothetical protein [Verrucomicrobiota bacterium]